MGLRKFCRSLGPWNWRPPCPALKQSEFTGTREHLPKSPNRRDAGSQAPLQSLAPTSFALVHCFPKRPPLYTLQIPAPLNPRASVEGTSHRRQERREGSGPSGEVNPPPSSQVRSEGGRMAQGARPRPRSAHHAATPLLGPRPAQVNCAAGPGGDGPRAADPRRWKTQP